MIAACAVMMALRSPSESVVIVRTAPGAGAIIAVPWGLRSAEVEAVMADLENLTEIEYRACYLEEVLAPGRRPKRADVLDQLAGIRAAIAREREHRHRRISDFEETVERMKSLADRLEMVTAARSGIARRPALRLVEGGDDG